MPDNGPTSRVFRTLRSSTFAALENPGFRRYYLGQGISLTGSWLQQAAVLWLVYQQSQSERDLGIVQMASVLPGLFVGLFAGALADRILARRMIILMECAQMALAFLLAALVGLGIVQMWQMATILAIARVCVTFELPSRQVFFYELVGPEVLSNAIALNSGLFNATRVLGPALAGVALGLVGATGCFALNGASFIAAIAAVLSIRHVSRPRPLGQSVFRPEVIFGGLGYLRTDRRIFTQFALVAFFGFVAMGYEAMVPAYATRIVRTEVGGYSLLMACGGVGATVGALVVASLGGMRRKERLSLLGMVIFGIALASAAFAPTWLLAHAPEWVRVAAGAICLLTAGFGAALFYSSSMTLIQLEVPDQLRGRIMGIWMIVFSGSVPLGALWTGIVAEKYGVGFVMGLSALVCIVTAFVVMVSGLLSAPLPKGPVVDTADNELNGEYLADQANEAVESAEPGSR
jgi:MFS family permease